MSILSALIEWNKDPGMQATLKRMSSPLAAEVARLSDRAKSNGIGPGQDFQGDRIQKCFMGQLEAE